MRRVFQTLIIVIAIANVQTCFAFGDLLNKFVDTAVNVSADQDSYCDDIKPFGNFEWEDGFLDVVAKLNSMAGIDKINIVVNGVSSENVKGVQGYNNVRNVLSKTMLGSYHYLDDPDRKNIGSFIIDKYFDRTGNEYVVYNRPVKIVAYPVMIKDVPFDITFTFTANPGIKLVRPEKVIVDNYNHSFPLLISEVVIGTNSPVYPANIKEISGLIKHKYGIGLASSTGTRDRQGNKFEIYASRGGMSMKYINTPAHSVRLLRVYQKHLADLESKKVKNKPDMSGGI